MARSVTFSGVTKLTPGAISRVTAVNLTPTGLATNGIVGLIGEADGGVPGEVVVVEDPVTGLETFKSGPLADAIKIAFDPSADPRITGSAFKCLCYKTNEATQSSTTLPAAFSPNATGTVDAGSTAAVINWTGTPVLDADSVVGLWMSIGLEKRRIVSNGASTATVSPAFSTTPATGASFSILQSGMLVTSRDYGEHTNQISIELEAGVTDGTSVVTVSNGVKTQQSPELGGKVFLEVEYLGGPVPHQGLAGAAAQNITITAATNTTVSATFSTAPTPSQYNGYIIEFSDGKRRLIASHNTSTSAVFTLDASTPLTDDEATDAVGQTMTIRAVTAATASITGGLGVATNFTTTITMVPSSSLDNLNLTFNENETLRAFINRVNATTPYYLSAPAGVNLDTTLMKTFDFGTRAQTVDIRFDHTIDYSEKGTFLRDLQSVVDWINEFSELVTAEREGQLQGAELPSYTGGVVTSIRDEAVFLVGGSRGVSTNTDFQNGFDAILLNRVNHVVPLISYDLANDGFGSTATFASVAAQLAAFVDEANAGSANECGGYIGADMTKTQMFAQTAVLNNANVQFFGQKLTVLDTSNSLVEKPEWSAAVNAASMRAGAAIGEPLTFKKLKTSALSNDPSWSTKNQTDRNQMVENGVMFAEEAPNGGFRWVRDMTTYLSDDNIVFLEGSTRDAVRYVVYNLRTGIEEQFTGLKASPATVANIREYVANALTQFWKADILVSSNDPEDPNSSTIIDGWRRLKVSISGNVASIKVEIFVVTGVVFELVDLYISVPQISG